MENLQKNIARETVKVKVKRIFDSSFFCEADAERLCAQATIIDDLEGQVDSTSTSLSTLKKKMQALMPKKEARSSSRLPDCFPFNENALCSVSVPK